MISVCVTSIVRLRSIYIISVSPDVSCKSLSLVVRLKWRDSSNT